MNSGLFTWTEIYAELATSLLHYKDDRKPLLHVLELVYEELEVLKYPFVDNGEKLDDIDPFTVMGTFNRNIKDETRTHILALLKKHFALQSSIPNDFSGIPIVNSQSAWFFAGKNDRNADDIQNLWDLFIAALAYADGNTDDIDFSKKYDKVAKQRQVKWNLTMGLYWCRPYTYINLDSRNKAYLLDGNNFEGYFSTHFSDINKKFPDGSRYLFLCKGIKGALSNHDYGFKDLPGLSYMAWKNTQDTVANKSNALFLRWFAPTISALKELGGAAKPKEVRSKIAEMENLSAEELSEVRGKNKVNRFASEVQIARNYLAYEGIIDKSDRGVWKLTSKGFSLEMDEQMASDIYLKWADIVRNTQAQDEQDDVDDRKHYWMYAAGEKSKYWEEFRTAGIMALGWEELGDLSEYADRSEMVVAMQEAYNPNGTFRNDSLATWQFVHNMKPGDIVYVKQGVRKLVGRGIVESDYEYDSSREYYKSVRRVKWTHYGEEWQLADQAVQKALTDITDYTEYVIKLEQLFEEDEIDDSQDSDVVQAEKYTEEDFLNEVFMTKEEYDRLSKLLLTKKNVILQGAPGVGKTFAAKRLAYSIMQVQDKSRVMIIQFHQSYSYEDFIMGYRPTKDGKFDLVPGPFYEFCQTAKDDIENEYFFIIDEINRGNLSKIFGELLMLIETDKRGESLRLMYRNEMFYVPENVHIIGMMNTADRSLAMIDYALRRRFAFYELKPAFNNEKFKQMRLVANNEAYDRLLDVVEKINEAIENDESLGSGFLIGHSYFCVKKQLTNDDVEAIVEYEILPLIREYWFDNKSNVDNWTKRLRETYEQDKE